ncbi:MAG: T9SS type A sorting domain-containing protein, partial [Saprospiraceae bacterium]|nr:T9SS type A sorting domain-containing protein [Saprospiraceae bacterium]
MGRKDGKKETISIIQTFNSSLKKYRSFWYTILAFYLFSGLCAQPVYQASDFAAVGDGQLVSIATRDLASFDFAATGANYTWNYSKLKVKYQQELAYIDPYLAGYKNAWCQLHECFANCKETFKSNFNLAIAQTDSIRTKYFSLSHVIEHYQKTDEALAAKMIGGTFNLDGRPIQLLIEYSHIDTLLKFPLKYGQEDHSTGRYVIDLTQFGIPVTYTTSLKRINEVEGWGSLSTPYITYPSVLKVKTLLIQSDTLFSEGHTYITQDTSVQYQWFDPKFAIPVLQAKGRVTSRKTVMTEASFYGSFQCLPPSSLFNYLPLVPVYDRHAKSADVFFSNLSINADSFYWAFDDGSRYNNINVIHAFDQPGIKQVKLKVYNSRCNPIRVDSITLPVIVVDTSTMVVGYHIEHICQGDSVYLQGAFQKTNGIYYDTLHTTTRYDSLMVTTLAVTNINVNLLIKLGAIASSEPDGNYQWLNCNDAFHPIPGATNPNFVPTTNGNYAVEITKSGCIDTTECYAMLTSSTPESFTADKIRTFPNPTRDQLHIEFADVQPELQFALYTMQGVLIQKQTSLAKKSIQLDLTNFANGMYLLVVSKPGSPDQ